jgi:hypothetical protein
MSDIVFLDGYIHGAPLRMRVIEDSGGEIGQ